MIFRQQFTSAGHLFIINSRYNYINIPSNMPQSERKKIQCVRCYEYYSPKKNLRCSVNGLHQYKVTYDCRYCGKQFSNEAELHIHDMSHTDKNRIQCNKCGKYFTYPRTLKEHKKICKLMSKMDRRVDLKSRQVINNFNSSMCGKNFKCPSNLNNQRLKKHKKICESIENGHALYINTKKLYKCSYCYTCFKFKSNMIRHKMVHFNKHKRVHFDKYKTRFVRCSTCSDFFLVQTFGNLNYKIFKCPTCEKIPYSKIKDTREISNISGLGVNSEEHHEHHVGINGKTPLFQSYSDEKSHFKAKNSENVFSENKSIKVLSVSNNKSSTGEFHKEARLIQQNCDVIYFEQIPRFCKICNKTFTGENKFNCHWFQHVKKGQNGVLFQNNKLELQEANEQENAIKIEKVDSGVTSTSICNDMENAIPVNNNGISKNVKTGSKCSDCEKCFSSDTELTKHIKQQKILDFLHICLACRKLIFVNCVLDVHIRNCTIGMIQRCGAVCLKCKECHQYFTSYQKLKKHEQHRKMLKSTYICLTCGELIDVSCCLDNHNTVCEDGKVVRCYEIKNQIIQNT